MKVKNQMKTSLDADDLIFFARELEYVKSKSYDVQYPELKARTLIPVDTSANAGATTITYDQYDQVGVAKIISNYADDAPRVDVKGKQFTVQVKDLGDSFGYNIREIRAAKMAGKPLQQRRADVARRAAFQKENDIALVGDSEAGFFGLLNHPNSLEYTVPADGGSTNSKLWSLKTADQIIRDINGLVNTPFDMTRGIEMADTLLLPNDKYSFISSTPRSANSDTTILDYVLKNNPYLKNVEPVYQLDGLGAGATDRMVAYKRDPMKLTLEVPSDFEMLPPQERNFEWVVPCMMSTGGVIVYYPFSIAFGDGI